MSYKIFTDVAYRKEKIKVLNEKVKIELKELYPEEKFMFYNAQYSTDFKQPTQKFRLVNTETNSIVTSCQMTTMMEQCSIVIFSQLGFNFTSGGLEFKKLMLNYYEKIARCLRFSTIITTVTGNQRMQLDLFPKCGYKLANKHRNSRSGNMIYTYIKNI